MITIEIASTGPKQDCYWIATTSRATTSAEATAIVRDAIARVDAHQVPQLWIRVTGGPTAAASRRRDLYPTGV